MGTWEGLYRVPASTIPGPIINHILKAKAYPRPNEGFSEEYDEVSQMGLEWVLEWVPEWLQNDPPGPPPDRSPDGLQMTLPDPQIDLTDINGPE